jgi:hypothetical protein
VHSLEDALDAFNRKERNLLVRAILAQEGLLHLSKPFRSQVAEKLHLQSIPENAWWATDYHISWLAGALALFVMKDNEKTAQDIKWPNPKNMDARRLVEGNQEDIDLVIATERNLILIEAKAYSAFGNAQLTHKLARLELLYEFYSKMVGTEPSEHAVNFHFLIISPYQPTKLKVRWPSWACKGRDVPWIKLNLDNKKPVFEVTRCDPNGNQSAAGDSWRIKPVASAAR